MKNCYLIKCIVNINSVYLSKSYLLLENTEDEGFSYLYYGPLICPKKRLTKHFIKMFLGSLGTWQERKIYRFFKNRQMDIKSYMMNLEPIIVVYEVIRYEDLFCDKSSPSWLKKRLLDLFGKKKS